jgi:hypothetical protein
MNDMRNLFQTIAARVDVTVTPMRLLLIGNMMLTLALIILSNLSVLPLRLWDFVFFSLLFLLIALYRLGWAFALFVGMLPLETINLAPVELGINVRPYQFLAILLLLALCVRLATRRVRWSLFVWQWQDTVVAIFLLMGCLLIPLLPFPELAMSALKQSLILLSFGLLYALGRIFVKQLRDVRIAVAFFLSSVFVILLYSVWQSLRFKWQLPSFEVMIGRPNGTLPEADFFGGLLAAIIAGMVPFGFQFFFGVSQNLLKRMLYGTFLFLLFLILILTVARSGWLAAGVGMIVGGGAFFLKRGIFSAIREKDMEFLQKILFGKFLIIMPLFFALMAAMLFHLTNFDLFDRGGSVSTGLQEITVSCDTAVSLPDNISDTATLAAYGCRHINLEEIDTERSIGHWMTTIRRLDPNISIRKNIYRESWTLIRSYPLIGIGWGSVSHFFGMDGRGAGLNASNVFLEIWLGTGIIGLILFLFLWISLPVILMLRLFRVSLSDEYRVPSLSLIAVWASLTVFNCFNSGLLLGSMWIFLPIFVWFVHVGRSSSAS